MVCWSWVGNGTLNYQSLSLSFFPCLLSFGLHRNFQEIVINLWWLIVPAPMKAGLICFSLAATKGQKLIYRSDFLPWDVVQAAAEPPDPGLYKVARAIFTRISSLRHATPIPFPFSMGTQGCTQSWWWEVFLLLPSQSKLQAGILQTFPMMVSEVTLTFPGCT